MTFPDPPVLVELTSDLRLNPTAKRVWRHLARTFGQDTVTTGRTPALAADLNLTEAEVDEALRLLDTLGYRYLGRVCTPLTHPEPSQAASLEERRRALGIPEVPNIALAQKRDEVIAEGGWPDAHRGWHAPSTGDT